MQKKFEVVIVVGVAAVRTDPTGNSMAVLTNKQPSITIKQKF